MKHLVWEEEHELINLPSSFGPIHSEHHLKVYVPRPDSPRPYKVSVAWVFREGKRKYAASVVAGSDHITREVRYQRQTFRSLKQAKAWCLAIYRLEN